MRGNMTSVDTTPPASVSTTRASTSYESSCRTLNPSSSARLLGLPGPGHNGTHSSGSGESALASLARGSLTMGLSADSTPVHADVGNASSVSLAVGGSTSSEVNTPMGESSNTVIGPNGTLVPRSSILLNPSSRKTFVDEWRVIGEDGSSTPGPTVLRIAAVPSEKDRAMQRERERLEREREIEREYREKEQAERVWGIPKKAFYLGMGEINFNAQMAMLGGWGNGSVGFPEMIAKAPVSSSPSASLLGRRKTSSSLSIKKNKNKRRESAGTAASSGKNKSRSGASPHDTTLTSHRRPVNVSEAPSTIAPHTNEGNKREFKGGDDDGDSSDTSIDLEELAALNTIINTRRSMEAAQKLASSARGALLLAPTSRDNNANEGSAQNGLRQSSAESVPSTAQGRSTSGHGSARIRFAPMPLTYNHSSLDTSGIPRDPSGVEEGANSDAAEEPDDAYNKENFDIRQAATEIDSDDAADEDFADGDERWSRRLSGSATKGGKWYLMGMPKSVLTSQYYRALRRPASGGGVLDASGIGDQQLSSSPSQDRRSIGGGNSGGGDGERRGRVRSRGRSSRASSIKSRSSSVGSIDEEDRERRRQLILASRPGGTGMVTLPDGRKVRARRVGEEYSDEEEMENMSEWGFARIARAAERRSIGDVEAEVGDKRMSDDEGGRESDFDEEPVFSGQETLTMVKRARRERAAAGEDADADSDEDEVSDPPVISVASEKLQDDEKEAHETTASDAEDLQDVEPNRLKATIGSKDVEQGPGPGIRQPKRAMTIPNGPITLSASQAAEVRRRHEEEVAALGAEVLLNLAKAKKAKQAQLDGSTVPPHSPPPPNSAHFAQHHHLHHPPRQHTVSSSTVASASPHQSSHALPTASNDAAAVQNDRGRSRSRPKRTISLDEGSKTDSTARMSSPTSSTVIASPLHRPLRAARDRLVNARAGSGDEGADADGLVDLDRRASPHSSTIERPGLNTVPDDDVALDANERAARLRTSTPPRVETAVYPDGPQTPRLQGSPQQAEQDLGDLTTSVSSLRTLRGRPQNDEHGVTNAVSADHDNIISSLSSPPLVATRDGSTALPPIASSQRSRSPLKHGLNRTSNILDLPSPWNLPRRPDARGYAVVPLPVEQLGRRPLRPQEGRFWQSDEDEDEDEDEFDDDDKYNNSDFEGANADAADGRDNDNVVVGDDGLRAVRRSIAGRRSQKADARVRNDDISDDDADSDLDAEQLAEEERRTALQKKRATTRAAGAEVVSGLGGKHKAQAGKSTTTATTKQKRSTSRTVSRERRAQPQLGRSHSSTSLGRSGANEMPISGDYYDRALPSSSSSHSKPSRSNRTLSSASGGTNGDAKPLRPVLSTSVLSTSRDSRGHSVARISRRRDTWNDFEESASGEDGAEPRSSGDADNLNLSDVDDLWPPTLDDALGGTRLPYSHRDAAVRSSNRSTTTNRPSLHGKRMTSSGSTLSVHSHRSGGGSSTSPVSSASTAAAQHLAAHAAKARIVRERREREQRDRERAHARQQRELDESLDYGWPRSLQGSSLY